MLHPAITANTTEIVSTHGFAEILQHRITKQKSLHALIPFSKGDTVSIFSAGEVFTEPSYLTVQKGISEHISLLPSFLQYINHSCNPNVFFDPAAMKITALKDIAVNEEFSFFYPSTELEMAEPFLCYCGSSTCLQNIRGARHIPVAILKQYQLTDFIKQQLPF